METPITAAKEIAVRVQRFKCLHEAGEPAENGYSAVILPGICLMATQRSSTASASERILAAVSSARDVPGGVRYDLVIANDSERVPAILMLPHAHAVAPAALLLHGLGSRKERLAD